MRSLNGKTALVTGAAGGIGRALAVELARQGVRLALADRDPFGLKATLGEVEQLGAEVHAHHCDLCDRGQLEQLVDQLLDRWAGVDLLVNNAGITYHGPTHTMPAEEWERLLEVNLSAHLRITQGLLPSMLARPEAHLLNVCSMLGVAGMPRVAAYCTSKFAMVGFSESLRAEYGRVGLGVTAFCPGFVDTGLFQAATPEQPGEAPKQPPRWLCTTPSCAARRAVRAIRRNEARVLYDPRGGLIYWAKRWMPRTFDFLLAIGRNRRVRAKQIELDQLDNNRETALRLKLGLPAPTAAEATSEVAVKRAA